MSEKQLESILQEAHRLTHGSRRADYGHPLDDYTRTAALVSAMLAHKLKEPLTAHEMALAMVCVKLSREMNVPKRDNATDGAGYFWVAHACLEEAARRAETYVILGGGQAGHSREVAYGSLGGQAGSTAVRTPPAYVGTGIKPGETFPA